jgi:hypothetical protein
MRTDSSVLLRAASSNDAIGTSLVRGSTISVHACADEVDTADFRQHQSAFVVHVRAAVTWLRRGFRFHRNVPQLAQRVEEREQLFIGPIAERAEERGNQELPPPALITYTGSGRLVAILISLVPPPKIPCNPPAIPPFPPAFRAVCLLLFGFRYQKASGTQRLRISRTASHTAT